MAVISENNLESFKIELYKNDAPQGGDDIQFLNIDLSSVLLDKNGIALPLNEQQQKYLAEILTHDLEKKNLETLLDHADSFPTLLGHLNSVLGRGHNHYAYNLIHDTLGERKISNNLAAIHAILSHGGSVYNVGSGEITSLTSKRRRYLNKIFEMSTLSSNGSSFEASETMKQLSGHLFNYEQATPELRKYINSQITTLEALKDLKEKFYTPELLSNIFKMGIGAKRDILIDTSKAKTQKEKNRNILPAYYNRTRHALLKYAENEPLYDSKNPGAEKSLTLRYQELCARLVGKNNWKMIDEHLRNGIMKDGLLLAAQKDILAGNADKLDKNALETVLRKDKQNFYLKKIPEQVIAEKNITLTDRQQNVLYVSDKEKASKNLEYVVNNNRITSEDKNDLINFIEKQVEENQPLQESLQKEIAEYKRDRQILEEKRSDVENKKFVAEHIDKIQEAFAKITRYFKDGIANSEEHFLTKDSMNTYITNYFNGTEDRLPYPEQKKLPLFIGREVEKIRRLDLMAAISQFNHTLDSIPALKLADFEDYKDKTLDPDTLNRAQKDHQNAQQDYTAAKEDFDVKYFDIAQKEQQEKALAANNEQLKKAKQHLNSHKEKLQTLSNKHLGKDNTVTLQPVTAEMSGDEKRAIRSQNKQVTDQLTVRAEKNIGLSDQEKVKNTVQEIQAVKYDRN